MTAPRRRSVKSGIESVQRVSDIIDPTSAEKYALQDFALSRKLSANSIDLRFADLVAARG